MYGIEIKFSGKPETAYAELLQQTTPALEHLYSINKSAFMALLYRIDVDENKVSQLSQKENKTGFFHALAALVVEREFIKVLTRKLLNS